MQIWHNHTFHIWEYDVIYARDDKYVIMFLKFMYDFLLENMARIDAQSSELCQIDPNTRWRLIWISNMWMWRNLYTILSTEFKNIYIYNSFQQFFGIQLSSLPEQRHQNKKTICNNVKTKGKIRE